MKIFNHEVTAGLLRGWLSKKNEKDGIWHWDIGSNAIEAKFEEGKKAKFAGVDYLYVGNFDGRALDVTIEDALALHESDLVRFTKKLWAEQAHNNNSDLLLAEKALAAIFGFANRGAWSLFGVSKALQLDEVGRIQFLNDQLQFVANSFGGWHFVFYQHSEVPLFIGDMPFFDMRHLRDRLPDENTNTCLMPLGPSALMIGYRPKGELQNIFLEGQQFDWEHPVDIKALNINLTIATTPLPPTLATLSNHFAKHRARRWLVASSEEQLSKESDFLSPDQVQNRILTDTISIIDGEGNQARASS